ncbi:MAG: PEPxxWA-CTERM sorting domain-containing protein [Novosphingobium sp.]
MSKSRIAALLASAALSTVGVAHAAPTITPAYEYTSAGTLSDSRPFTLGFDFSLSNAVTVNALGYTTVDFVTAQDVGIWDSLGNLIVSALVDPTDPVTGHFAWHGIASTLLSAGTYTIGGTYQTGQFPSYASGLTNIPEYTWLRDQQLYGPGLNQPTATYGGYGLNGIPQVNFSVGGAVPEPATWGMMVAGVAAIGATMRRRQKVTVSYA